MWIFIILEVWEELREEGTRSRKEGGANLVRCEMGCEGGELGDSRYLDIQFFVLRGGREGGGEEEEEEERKRKERRMNREQKCNTHSAKPRMAG